jgi:phosphotriesterase-related protein
MMRTVKKIMTVTGPIDPEDCGATLIHEHVLVDFSPTFEPSSEASLAALSDEEITIEHLPILRRRPWSAMRRNLILGDEEWMAEELAEFALEGGRTVVEVTPTNTGRDPRGLARLSRRANVNIVMGGSLYYHDSHPAWVEDASLEDLVERFTGEVRDGVAGSGVRPGIIGEVGTTGRTNGVKDGHITPREEKVLRASGRAGVETGLAVTVHLDNTAPGAFEIIRILDEEGVPRDRMIMDHMDGAHDVEYSIEVAKQGVYVAYDCFGREYYSLEKGPDFFFGSDKQRVADLKRLVDEGLEDFLVVSHDHAMKIDLRRFGGVGYGHMLSVVVPMMRVAGIPPEAIRKMLIDNPRNVLTADWDDDLLDRASLPFGF